MTPNDPPDTTTEQGCVCAACVTKRLREHERHEAAMKALQKHMSDPTDFQRPPVDAPSGPERKPDTPTDSAARPVWLRHACPLCRARPGERCHTANESRRPVESPHVRRVRAATFLENRPIWRPHDPE